MLAEVLEQPKTKSVPTVANTSDPVNLDNEMLGLSNRLYAMATKMELHASNESVRQLLNEKIVDRERTPVRTDALISEITQGIDELEQKIAFLTKAF